MELASDVETGIVGVEREESFIVNSRTRIQATARSRFVAPLGLQVVDDLRQLFVGIDSHRVRSATTSSWVIARTISRSARSLNRPSRPTYERPDLSRCRGRTTGMYISCPRIPSISSRMMFSILRMTRHPSGSREKMPEPKDESLPPAPSTDCSATRHRPALRERVRPKRFDIRRHWSSCRPYRPRRGAIRPTSYLSRI